MVCTSLETAHAAICQLVHDFAAEESHYLSPGYSEAQARISFIDKLWQALGWDVTHEQQKNPYAQEVKVEDPQKISGSARRADYAFHTAPNFRDARFFCEAKKPAIQLKTDADAAFQTIRYGYSAGTPLAVLTDFEQFHILDCRAKPDIDTALARSHRYFHYRDWLDPDKFAQLYYLFSREAFTLGTAGEPSAFDTYVAKLPRPNKVGRQLGLLRTGHEQVGLDFLNDLEGYREDLAKLLKAADRSLDGDALTELVQRILDRLVFLRFLEDKLIETEIQVAHFSLAAGGHSWAKFLSACRKLNDRYNGIVFKPHPTLDGPARLPVDDVRFADLCEELSHTRSPYDFNAIPIHILGSIYERFLGKVIVTTGQRARVDWKPEYRKSNGVYYTPAYIVRYIVQQTVGQLVEGKAPTQIAKMRFADIACGSGSFLLGLYECLLDAHTRWYAAHRAEAEKENLAPPDKGKKRKREFIPAVVERGGVLRLTLEKKRDILLNNVFGVDLDPQAVEVAQLSLYLKLLEDETTATARQHYLDFHEALLPSLSKNIVRGNSLIGTDILFGHFEFSAQEERKLVPMDFQSAFPAVFKDGGFDAIVGNPPYFNIDDTWGAKDPRLRVIKDTFADIHTDKTDVLFYFLARATKLVKSNGSVVGMIVSRAFLEAFKATKLRAYLSKHYHPTTIIDFRNYHVFEGVGITTAIVVMQPADTVDTISSYKLLLDELPSSSLSKEVQNPAVFENSNVRARTLSGAAWSFSSSKVAALNAKMDKTGSKLGEVMVIGQGMQTGLNGVFGNRTNKDIKQLKLKQEHYRLRASNSQILRYQILPAESYIIFIEDIAAFKRLSEQAQEYFLSHRKELSERAAFRRGDCEWWKFTWPLHYELYGGPKLLCPYMAKENRFAIDKDDKYLGLTDTTVLFPKSTNILYLLGLLNSKALTFRFKTIGKLKSGGVLEYFWNSISKLPIRILDLTKPAEKAQHDRMVQLVEAMLSTQQQFAAAGSDADLTFYQSKADSFDWQIDELTFDLYGFTAEERTLVRGA